MTMKNNLGKKELYKGYQKRNCKIDGLKTEGFSGSSGAFLTPKINLIIVGALAYR